MSENDSGLDVSDSAVVSARKKKILFTTVVTVPLTAAAIVIPFGLGWGSVEGTLSGPEQLVFSMRWIFLALIPYVSVCLLIMQKRLFEGSHNPIVDQPSMALSIHCRVMQNHLEQFVWFAVCALTLATLLRTHELHVIPIVSVIFFIARFVYWWGYMQDGTVGRRFGVQMTSVINGSLLVAAGGLSLIR